MSFARLQPEVFSGTIRDVSGVPVRGSCASENAIETDAEGRFVGLRLNRERVVTCFDSAFASMSAFGVADDSQQHDLAVVLSRAR